MPRSNATNRIECLYLLLVQLAGEETITTVCVKYGRTNNLPRRFSEHRRDFEKKGFTISLFHYVEIVPASLPQAEQQLRVFIKELQIPKYCDGRSRELLQVRDGDLAKLLDCYKRISTRFGAAIIKQLPPSPAKRYPSSEQISRLPPSQAGALLGQLRKEYLLAREAELRAEQRYHACLAAMEQEEQ